MHLFVHQAECLSSASHPSSPVNEEWVGSSGFFVLMHEADLNIHDSHVVVDAHRVHLTMSYAYSLQPNSRKSH